MRFTKLKWKNLFSFGDYESEIALDQDGIVFIRGTNKDDNTSNGSGKSSILDVFVWTLYGKPLKSIPADNVVNTHVPYAQGHGCVEFWHGTDYFEINRYRDHKEFGNGVLVKKNGSPDDQFTDGTNRDVQARIDELLGLDYFALTSSIIYSTEVPFQIPRMTAEKRRAYLEAMLGLQAYSGYGKTAKNRVRNLKRDVEDIVIEEREKKNFLASEKDDLEKYIESHKNFASDKAAALAELQAQLVKLDADIAGIDLSERVALEKEILRIKTDIDSKKQRLTTLTVDLNKVDHDIATVRKEEDYNKKAAEKEMANAITAYEKSRRVLQSSIDLMKQECPTCKRGWDSSEVDEHTTKYQAELNTLKTEHDAECNTIKGELTVKNTETAARVMVLKTSRIDIENSLTDVKREANVLLVLLDTQTKALQNLPSQITLDNLNDRRSRLLIDIEKKEAEQNPYKEVIDNLHIKINDTIESLDKIDDKKIELDEKLKYATFWDESFNNDGLKLFIFETVIPVLNARIGFYLPLLFDGKDVKLSFDKMMNMNIFAGGKVMAYGGMSQGERKRIDLAIAFALLDTAQAQHGIISNVMFFDELLDGSLDKAGVKTVVELLRAMPVQTIFLMSHRQEISQEFDQILDVEKRGKFSRILT